jgi:hypothetical protein
MCIPIASQRNPYDYLVKLDWYETMNTNYAIDENWSQVTKVKICEDSPLFVASNCVSDINEYQCKGNQMIKLFSKDYDDWVLEKVGKYQFCGTCSELEFQYSTKKYGYGCKDFWVFAGCFGNEQCSGQLTLEGTIVPSSQPTRQPSRQPTGQPSRQPTGQPSRQPTRQPTGQPSSQPTMQPSRQPSSQPSSTPTHPTGQPTSTPTQPTGQPSRQPTKQPTGQPTGQPSRQPTGQPSSQPSRQPSGQPSRQPSTQPTSSPTVYMQWVDYSEFVQNSFDTCAAGLDYIRMENEEDTEMQEKMPEVRSADWTESNKYEPKTESGINTTTNNETIDNIKVKRNINYNNDDDDENETLKDSISLRYFIRVLVQDAAGRSCWDTTEIKLYRGGRHISIVPVAAAIPDV